MAAFGGFLAMMLSSQTGFRSHSGWALILPTNSNGNYNQQDTGIFYPYLPDLPIARIIFLAGILAAFLGLLGLPVHAGGRRLRAAAAVITLVGVASVGTAVGLVRSAQLSPRGTVIPALHNAASDRPLAYTPVCGLSAQTPVCLNPAYGRYLPDVAAALAPVLAEVAGLPGAPVRADQIADDTMGILTISGSPPVLAMPLGADPNLPGSSGFGYSTTEKQFADILREQFLRAFVTSGAGPQTAAQQAVEAALLQRAGIPFADQPRLLAIAEPGPAPEKATATGPVYDAAQRLAALPVADQRAWLTAHLADLRSGVLTLAQLP